MTIKHKIPCDNAHCATGATCGKRSRCLRLLSFVERSKNPEDSGIIVVFGPDPKDCEYFRPIAKHHIQRSIALL
ncbi:MAG: hypothetical protein ACRC62_37015 [Microcoleus sp.]